MKNDNFADILPKKFVENTLDLCGSLGEKWLKSLPEIIGELSGKWKIEAGKPFENLSYNYVAGCFCADNSEAVLKIALPLNEPEIFNEARYLKIRSGKGAVKVLNFDKTLRAMLLEKLDPGKHLKEIFAGDKQAAVEIAVELMKKLLREPPADSGFLRLEVWFENFFRKAENTKFPQEYTEKTREIFYYFNDSTQKFLLHGDLHHENILSAEREAFLVIDPKGIIGEIGYEISVFLNNHLWWLADEPDVRKQLNYAVEKFSEAFGIEKSDLKKWAFAQIVLSAWWTFEDNGKNWDRALAFAEFWDV